MNRWLVAGFMAVALVRPALSEEPVETDANLLTAIDESASVGRHGEWLQYNGMARALVSPEFLEAVRHSGRHARVGFSVVAWSSHGNVRVVLPWMVVASEADAIRAAELIQRAWRVYQASWDDEDDTGARHATDISATIDAAAGFVESAPFPSERGVINILANGRDNLGPGPRSATRRAVSLGLTVNGVVFGDEPGLAGYFRDQVIGGPGSFVETGGTAAPGFNDAMVRKLRQDLIS